MTIAVYRVSDGSLFSVASDISLVADPLPAGLALKDLGAVDPQQPPAGSRYEWNAATLVFDLIALGKLPITPLEFWQRFTTAEREAVVAMARTGTETQKNKISAFKEYVVYGDQVDLDDQNIIDGVNLMESVGLIAAGRAAEVLA